MIHTTFGTQKEGYKLHGSVFFNNKTNRWEVAGLCFLSTETKENVELGMKYFKESLDRSYDTTKIGRFIFMVNKGSHQSLKVKHF